MPATAELIASGRTIAQIEELIGADRLIYLDLHGLIRSVRHDNSEITEFDTSCFSGEYVGLSAGVGESAFRWRQIKTPGRYETDFL